MRRALPQQERFDCASVKDLNLNVNCRDEFVPILVGLQHLYGDPVLRAEITDLVAADVNEDTRADCGRNGMDYWQIVVLTAVRLGCNYDYDHLQNLAEEHNSLRCIMRVGDWDKTSFSWRTIRNNICMLSPETIESISQVVVKAGHEIAPDSAEAHRADSTVVDTNIHYPTESSLIYDGCRKILELCACLFDEYDITGWRQHAHLSKEVKKCNREISRIVAKKGGNYKERLAAKYGQLLRRAQSIIDRAKNTCSTLESDFSLDTWTIGVIEQIRVFIERTEQVCGTARRRVLKGETVPNSEKLFSIFEPHTQLYRRGKAGEPNQYGRLVLFYEDAAGFITHHHVIDRDEQDNSVIVEQTRSVQERLGNAIKSLSLDRGFYSAGNQNNAELEKIVDNVCLPKPGVKQSAEQNENATPKLRKMQQRHSGIESAIGALQAGNGLDRCRDSTERGFKRYVALAVLGRNLQTLGRMLIAASHPDSHAAYSERQAA